MDIEDLYDGADGPEEDLDGTEPTKNVEPTEPASGTDSNFDDAGDNPVTKDTDDHSDPDGVDGTSTTPQGAEEPKVELSGIENYLSQFDIEGGMINFDDGSTKHFNELDSDKQAEVLTELHKTNTKSVEDTYGLDETEIGLINLLRERGASFEDVVNDIATQRVNSILASQQTGSIDYDKMDADAIYARFLYNSNPDATQAQIDEDLEKAKSMSNYDKVVDRIKSTFKTEQKAELDTLRQTHNAEMQKELEDQRAQVVQTVSGISELDGIQLDDTMKNTVLDTILSVDEDGDSRFMTEVFSDPTKLFKAALWYKNGADLLKSREAYWKKEKSQAFIRGQKSASERGINFTADDKEKTTPQYDPDEIIGFDDIH